MVCGHFYWAIRLHRCLNTTWFGLFVVSWIKLNDSNYKSAFDKLTEFCIGNIHDQVFFLSTKCLQNQLDFPKHFSTKNVTAEKKCDWFRTKSKHWYFRKFIYYRETFRFFEKYTTIQNLLTINYLYTLCHHIIIHKFIINKAISFLFIRISTNWIESISTNHQFLRVIL